MIRSRKKRYRSNPIPALIATLITMMILAVIVVGLMDERTPVISLDGGEDLVVECGSKFSDPGYSVRSQGALFGVLGWPFGVDVSGYVNTTELGEYEITYKTEFMGRETSTTRKIHVVDNSAPVIQLTTDTKYHPSWLEGYKEEGYTAYDTRDGDLTGQVTRTENGDTVTYTVTDSNGNTTTRIREIDYTIGCPKIVLNGDAFETITANMRYTDPGFTATDDKGNDLSSYVEVQGEVRPDTPGDYVIYYSITNKAGETVTATRCVTVEKAAAAQSTQGNGKVIYLTFDDGPCSYTAGLLDTLAKYDVKATFFVTNAFPDYAYLIGRAYREGHSIGVHTYTHEYNKIYASEEAYYDDFWKMQEIIHEQTGYYTSLFRFPGGSSNTVSSFNPGIMSRLSQRMTEMGYSYFDWNVLSGDAGDTTSTSKIIQNIKEGCSSANTSIVLQHDIKNYSIAAVESIIVWGLENGYRFEALQPGDWGAHHDINN